MLRKNCLCLAIYFSKNRTAIKVAPHDVTDDVSAEKECHPSAWCSGLSICLSSGTGHCVQKRVLEHQDHGQCRCYAGHEIMKVSCVVNNHDNGAFQQRASEVLRELASISFGLSFFDD